MLDGLGLGETGGVVAGGVEPAAAAAVAVGAATDTAGTRSQVSPAACLSKVVGRTNQKTFHLRNHFRSTHHSHAGSEHTTSFSQSPS